MIPFINHIPAWAVMWITALTLYATLKLLVWSRASVANAPLWRHIAFLIAWPGLNATAFLDPRLRPQIPTLREWFVATTEVLVGISMLYCIDETLPLDSPFLVGWIGLIGFGLSFHFGLFRLLSCFWRSVGAEARPIMDAPFESTSVIEFWSKRWNTAFRDFTNQFVFRPLARRWGAPSALFLTFLFSGIVHELVISLPAGGGYGRPTEFFLIQSLAAMFEKSRAGRTLRLTRGIRGWCFTSAVVVLPAPLLFHDQFLRVAVVPFLHALGAI
ncbi:MAG TPA: membrane bound O-acyl transferase family-domain-containing protein [Lacipirellulaceae bacterium]|jgi:alginate O-acetyltransferase complex protein AlgI|nr:membrane bound O-acyl transferase family-domain-containing protein [Lacipirellulaceae bacterium]